MLTLRESRSGDGVRLAEIARLSPEAGNWSEDDFAPRPERLCLVAERGAQIAGFLLASRPAPDEAEILTLAVDPAARRQGVASALIEAFLARRPGRVYLEVRRSNAPAQQLYRRFGFSPTGIRRAYYASPVEDAIVMQAACFQ
jgi:ribosomal-protein-alanine N-acetyltransferase